MKPMKIRVSPRRGDDTGNRCWISTKGQGGEQHEHRFRAGVRPEVASAQAVAENDRGLEWVSKDRDVAVDRTFSEFETVPSGRIRFNVVTQAIQVMQDDSRPVELPRRLRLVCNVAVTVPTCVEQPQPRERFESSPENPPRDCTRW